jgi:hypothetical protein
MRNRIGSGNEVVGSDVIVLAKCTNYPEAQRRDEVEMFIRILACDG